MDCNTAQRLIVLLLDNELSDEKILELYMHLEGCPECTAEMIALKRTTDAMNVWQDVQPNFTLADIRARASTRRPWWEKVHLPNPSQKAPGWSTVVGAALCICIGIIGGIGLDNLRQSDTPIEAVDAIITGFDDPVGDALPWMIHTSSDSQSTKHQQEDSL